MNVSKVTGNFLRGSRPNNSADLVMIGFNWRAQTVISLETGFGRFWDGLSGREFNEQQLWENGWHRAYISHPLSNFTPPTRSETELIIGDIKRGLEIGPVFLHCYSGVDRTGWICAAWRVLEEGKDAESAWAEAKLMGMHHWYFWWKSAFMEAMK